MAENTIEMVDVPKDLWSKIGSKAFTINSLTYVLRRAIEESGMPEDTCHFLNTIGVLEDLTQEMVDLASDEAVTEKIQRAWMDERLGKKTFGESPKEGKEESHG